MANFHLMHCVPNRLMHGLYGYLEIIQTVEWGLKQLGHQVSYGVNEARRNCKNIIFGAHVLPVELLSRLPPDSVVYNFEQMRGLKPDQIRAEVFEIARKFEIWDYTAANISGWAALDRSDVSVVPVSYAPILTRIPECADQDIDVLIYGKSGQQRLRCFDQLSRSGLTTVFISGLYGAARDELIARSRLILNVTAYEHSKIFEIARVSYLLANRKAVVAIVDPETYIEQDLRSACCYTDEAKFLQNCTQLLDDAGLRTRIRNAGFDIFSQRAIVDSLKAVLKP